MVRPILWNGVDGELSNERFVADRMIEINETQHREDGPRVFTNVQRAMDNVELESAEGHGLRPHPSHGRLLQRVSLIDGMGRDIQTGDILTWNSGGYYSNFMSYGIVKDVHIEHSRIRVINYRGKGVNIWVTQNTVIIAKRDNYESIPDDFLRKFGVI